MLKRAAKHRKIGEHGRSRKRAPYVVFISHSSKDQWIAMVMAEKIEALGTKVWIYEKNLEGGDVIMDSIFNGIDASDEAIVLVSPDSIGSQWVVGEIGAILSQRKA